MVPTVKAVKDGVGKAQIQERGQEFFAIGKKLNLIQTSSVASLYPPFIDLGGEAARGSFGGKGW